MKRKKKKKLTKRALERIGKDYAMYMGYTPLSNGRWRTKSGGVFTTSKLAKVLTTIPNFIVDDTLNYNEVRRVNRGCPANQEKMI